MSLMDLLIKTDLFEMAYTRKEIINKTNDLSYEIIKHLMKIYYFYNKDDLRGHIKSINSWLEKVQKMTLDGKNRLKPEKYFECFIENSIGDGHMLKTMYKILEKQGYKPSLQKMKLEEFFDFLCKKFLKISEDISKCNFITIEDYFNFKEL